MDIRKRDLLPYWLIIFNFFSTLFLLNLTYAVQSDYDLISNLDHMNSSTNIKPLIQELSTSECEKCNCSANTVKEFTWADSARDVKGVSVHPQPIPDISDVCQAVLHNFSVSVANFSYCIAMNARPITVCQDCINEYQQVTYWFKNISSDDVTGCNEELLNRDHLLVVQSLAREANQFWETARCSNCYSNPPQLCNDTLGFLQLLDQVTNCINSTQNNQSEVCMECRDDYLKLNEYYEKLNTIYNNRLCMDVIDGMNITRHMWSSTYQCTRIKVEGLPVLLTSLGFLLLPVLYYCGNRFIASAKDTRLVQPKRMSFVHASYSSSSLQR